ncbi:PfkB family carbohydrate kinase, partial [Escherichia coli]
MLDTSGEALRQGLASGTVTLVKPSRGELEALVGQRLSTRAEVIAAARDLVARRQAKMVAVTLGHEGAVLAHRGGVVDCPALPV